MQAWHRARTLAGPRHDRLRLLLRRQQPLDAVLARWHLHAAAAAAAATPVSAPLGAGSGRRRRGPLGLRRRSSTRRRALLITRRADPGVASRAAEACSGAVGLWRSGPSGVGAVGTIQLTGELHSAGRCQIWAQGCDGLPAGGSMGDAALGGRYLEHLDRHRSLNTQTKQIVPQRWAVRVAAGRRRLAGGLPPPRRRKRFSPDPAG